MAVEVTGETQAVRRLAALGAPFDRDQDGGFVQGLEAAHGRARVARVGGDGAGRAIMVAVIGAVRAAPTLREGESSRMRWGKRASIAALRRLSIS